MHRVFMVGSRRGSSRHTRVHASPMFHIEQEGGHVLTLLERPKVWQVPETPTGRRFEWTMWVVLAFLIVAGETAGILLSVDDVGVSDDEVAATLALENSWPPIGSQP